MTPQPEVGKKMNYYKATIQYDGTGYAGFQWQKDITSIQNDFNQAIKNIIPGKITTMGASRTDQGVHALKQIVKISSQYMIDDPSFLNNLNHKLSSQIKCLEFQPCCGDFKPASDPILKEYRYYFTNKKNVPRDDLRFISNFSLNLDLDLMKKCTQEIVGTHDFQNFCSSGSNVKSTIRTINFCELTQIDPHDTFSTSNLFSIPKDLQSCFELRIQANGFLKQMIRHIMSALWMVGSGKITEDEFISLLNGPKKEKRIWKAARPNGLFLFDIKY